MIELLYYKICNVYIIDSIILLCLILVLYYNILLVIYCYLLLYIVIYLQIILVISSYILRSYINSMVLVLI